MKNKKQYHLEHLLTVSEAAKICCQTNRQMERHIKEKKVRVVRLRNVRLIRPVDLETFIKRYGRWFVRSEDIEPTPREVRRARRSLSPETHGDGPHRPGATEMKNWMSPSNPVNDKTDATGEAPKQEAAGGGLLVVKEVAASLGVQPRTVRQWAKIRQEKLTGKRQGKPK
jgi:hypothetical protein